MEKRKIIKNLYIAVLITIVFTSCASPPSRENIIGKPNTPDQTSEDSKVSYTDGSKQEYEEEEPGIIRVIDQIQGNFFQANIDAHVVLPQKTDVLLFQAQKLQVEPETILDLFWSDAKEQAETNILDDPNSKEPNMILQSKLDNMEVAYSQNLGTIHFRKETTGEAMDRSRIMKGDTDAPGNPVTREVAESYAFDMIEKISIWSGVHFELYEKVTFDSTEYMTNGFYDFLYAPIVNDLYIEPRDYEFSGSRIGIVSGGGVRITVTDEVAGVMIHMYEPIDDLKTQVIISPQDAVTHLKEQAHLLAAGNPLNIEKIQLFYLPLMDLDQKYKYILIPYWTFDAKDTSGQGVDITIRINGITGELLT